MAPVHDQNRRLEEEISSLFAVLHEGSSEDAAEEEEPTESWVPLARYFEPPSEEPREDSPLDDIRSISRSYRELQEEARDPSDEGEVSAGLSPAEVHDVLQNLIATQPSRPRFRWRGSLAAAALAAIAVAGAVAAIVVLPI